MDIAQYADGTIEVLYRGYSLRHHRYSIHPHLKQGKSVDSKQINARVDAAMHKQRQALGKLLASIAHQDHQRSLGVYTMPTPDNAPPRGFRPRPEPANPLSFFSV